MKKTAERDPEARMTFTEHLAELRTRIIRVGIALIIGFAICYIFSNQLFDLVRRPLEHQDLPWEVPNQQADPNADPATLEQSVQWLQTNPLQWFLLSLKLSAYGGLLLMLPYILLQIGGFIFPGLKTGEKRIVLMMLIGCSALSLVGLLVAYFGVFPVVLPYILRWTPDPVVTMLNITETVSMILLGLLGFAVVFQFPMVVLILVYMDLLTPAALKQYRKQAIVGMAVLSAVLTPPDPISMLFMMTPLVLLYEASIWTSYIVVRRKKKAAQAAAGA
jgi:sec-independent protein translocase protein TatC